MKKNALTVAVMCATFLSPIVSSAAMADTIPTPIATPGQIVVDGMQDQCDALAAAHDTGNGDLWTGEVVLGAVTLTSGPTEVDGTRVIDLSTVVGIGPLHPSDPYIDPNVAPYRTGGSVNLFGDQRASAAYYDDSTYTYTADFESTFSHAFTCNIYHAVYHPETQEVGMYIIDPNRDPGQSNEAVQHECDAYNARGQHLPLPGYWGNSPQGHCVFVPGNSIPEYWDPAVLTGNEAGTPIDVDQTDSLTAFEDHGGRFEVSGDLFIGQVVVCISPSNGPAAKKGVPGSWRPQNGYSGGDPVGPAAGCNTNYFNVAPWGSGSQTSNGTYISVPPAV